MTDMPPTLADRLDGARNFSLRRALLNVSISSEDAYDAAARLRKLDRIEAALRGDTGASAMCLDVDADWIEAEGSDDAVDAASTMRTAASLLRRLADALAAEAVKRQGGSDAQ